MSYKKAHFGICSKCRKTSFVSTHHKFKQKKWARDLYGDLLDLPFNLVEDLCNCDCHKWADANDTMTELEFCEKAIEYLGYKVIPRSDEGLAIWNRNGQKYRP